MIAKLLIASVLSVLVVAILVILDSDDYGGGIP